MRKHCSMVAAIDPPRRRRQHRAMEAAIDPPPRLRRREQRDDIQDDATTTTILELPSHITCEILSRLPLKSIFNCKRVCSSFRNLTLDPNFAQSHLPRSFLCLILHRTSNRGRPTYFGFLPLHDSLVDLRRRRATVKFETQIESPGRRLFVVSCNGLICLSDKVFPNNVYVCNPLTRQHFRLPESKNQPSYVNELDQLYSFWCGIGYSRSANLFKVVKFTANCQKPLERHCSIYTLGVDDEWRILGDAGLPFPRDNFVFLNGAFHWIDGRNLMSLLLGYFDMEKEQFGNLPFPCQFSGYGFRLGAVDNCLYISDERTFAGPVNIWVMKDYRNIESWTLEWIIQRPLPSGLNWDLKPVKSLADGTVLMIVGTKTLACYNPVSTVLTKISYHGVKFWEGSIADVPSFLPLPGL